MFVLINVENFKDHIADKKLFREEDGILLAVSGGIDSVVMAHLFYASGFNFGIAHCNFQLREDDADGDEAFTQTLAQKFNVPFYSIRFNTAAYAEERKISIQMAARELRYTWFDQLLAEHGYVYVAVAHHLNDSVETVLINMVRGTGIAGLHGIAAKRDRIIRPLLDYTREEIGRYAVSHRVEWREDRSNESDHYLRNKIRHQIVPVLKELNPKAEQHFALLIRDICETEVYLGVHLEKERARLFTEYKDHIEIPFAELEQSEMKEFVLYQLLKDFGFLRSVIPSVLASMKATSGKCFYSVSHRLLADRNRFILAALKEQEDVLISLEQVEEPVSMPHGILIPAFKTTGDPFLTISRDPAVAMFDNDRLTFPLELRKWRPGDYFIPIGMKGRKKLSDFFIDEKFSIHEKDNTFVLVSDGQIVWVVGHRIDDRFKITQTTKAIFSLTLINE